MGSSPIPPEYFQNMFKKRNEFFFDYNGLILKNQYYYPYLKKTEKYKKALATTKLMNPVYERALEHYFYDRSLRPGQEVKLQNFFLSQIFKENKRLFLFIGKTNKRKIKYMFLRSKYVKTILVNIERRLDTNLTRSLMLPNLSLSKQAIQYGYVFINRKQNRADKYILRQKDVVTLNPNFIFLTSLPNFKIFFVRVKIKSEYAQQYLELLKQSFAKLSVNFNCSWAKLALKRSHLSYALKFQLLLLLTFYAVRKYVVKTKMLIDSRLLSPKILYKFDPILSYVSRVKNFYRKKMLKLNQLKSSKPKPLGTLRKKR